MSRGIRTVAVIIGAVLFAGLLWGVVGIAERWFRGQLPQGEWWHLLLAIPAIGVVALAFEALGEGIGHAFGINKPGTPKWKEYLGILAIIGAVVAILVVLYMVRA
jgi:hypothetical protein